MVQGGIRSFNIRNGAPISVLAAHDQMGTTKRYRSSPKDDHLPVPTFIAHGTPMISMDWCRVWPTGSNVGSNIASRPFIRLLMLAEECQALISAHQPQALGVLTQDKFTPGPCPDAPKVGRCGRSMQRAHGIARQTPRG
jgi:hypothetical protein